MTHRTPLIALAVLAALSAGAFAATPAAKPDPQRHGPASLDKNGDGFIDRSEAAASPRLASAFDTLDKDKDGKLSREELRQGRHGNRGPGARKPGGHEGGFLARLDTNKDGRVSRDEAKADAKFAERFDAMDANKDGFIDKADFQARAQQHRDRWFAEADTDKDGKLSKAEFDAASAKRAGFDRPRPPKAAKPAAPAAQQ